MKVTYNDFGAYSEIGQVNPIRWVVMKKDENGDFSSQSSTLRCKDFFNDWVYTRKTKKPMKIYGFDTGKMDDIDDKKAGFVLVYNICPRFLDNLKVLNEFLLEQTPGIFIIDNYVLKGLDVGPSLIIEIPPYFLENTYRISLLSLLIRLMNNDIYLSWKQILKFAFNYQDAKLFESVKNFNTWFQPHPIIDKYIWFAGKEYNSMSPHSHVSSFIHNNGVVNWATAIGNKNAL